MPPWKRPGSAPFARRQSWARPWPNSSRPEFFMARHRIAGCLSDGVGV
jgi:hypothetical protein